MDTFKLILMILFTVLSLANIYSWTKAETGSIEELGYIVKSFGFTILLYLS